jgi:hypothetical protein
VGRVQMKLFALACALLAACGAQVTGNGRTPKEGLDASRRPDTSGRPDGSVLDVAPTPDVVIPVFDGPVTPWDAPTATCTAENLLDRDSFDVVGAGIAGCLAGDAEVTCTKSTNELTLTNLPEGVGAVAFEYGTASDGTHLLEGRGVLVSGNPPTVVFRASEIPAPVDFDTALVDFFSEAELPFACTF